MNINTITAEDLRRMPDKEGLILQGCGGDLTEWVDGINEMLTKAGILKDGCQFENVAAFQHGDPTKARTLLGWNPCKTSFEELVRIMVRHDMEKVKRMIANKH